MRAIEIGKNEAGQRLDKLLAKYLSQAPKGFLYKMLRKKNITLNGKKADGRERLAVGDEVKLFLAEDTIEKFSRQYGKQAGEAEREGGIAPAASSHKTCAGPLEILYEDEHVLIVNKPAGALSQRADQREESMVERVIAHCLETGKVGQDELRVFRPSVCNRLDRNTSGILVAGTSLLGLQEMARLFHDRTIHKYYYCIVLGRLERGERISGYLTKDHAKNKVRITKEPLTEESQWIETEYEPLSVGRRATLLRVLLITGRSHQIRAHLLSIGHPILGDGKYGDREQNQVFREAYGIQAQMLHAGKVVFPAMEGACSALSGRIVTAPFPRAFERVIRGEGLSDHGDMEHAGA